MNFLGYKFAKETEPELLKFLKVAQECKSANKNCNLDEHQAWQELLRLDSVFIQKLEESVTDNPVIIDLSSDEEPVISQLGLNEKLEDTVESLGNCNNSSISDVAFEIKENLETQQILSETAKQNLGNFFINELEELFEVLNQTLNSEEVFHLGVSLQSGASNTVMSLFCRHLLIPWVTKEYCDNLLTLVNQYSIKYSSVLKEEFLSKLHEINGEEIVVFMQYINNLNLEFQSLLLRDLIFTIEKLNENYVMIIENMLNSQVEYEALNKLVEMLSNIAEDHSKDKAFGKLLMNVIQFLGSNVMLLEQPLKHIIAGHKSVWRSKLEKTFSTCYEDTLMFSQSFRD